MSDNPFNLRKRAKSFMHAFEGIIHLFKHEHNSWVHAAAMITVVIAGFIFELNTLEWILVTLAIAMVFTAEVINTAIERTVDLITQEVNPLAKQAKDLAAAAVLVTAIAAIIVAILIFGPKIASKINPEKVRTETSIEDLNTKLP